MPIVDVTAQCCTGCGKVRYTDKYGVYGHWMMPQLVAASIVRTAHAVTCPGCEKVNQCLTKSYRIIRRYRAHHSHVAAPFAADR